MDLATDGCVHAHTRLNTCGINTCHCTHTTEHIRRPCACALWCNDTVQVMFMHDNGFCHRDIKPENAMVQRHNHQLKVWCYPLSICMQPLVIDLHGAGRPKPHSVARDGWADIVACTLCFCVAIAVD